MCRNIKVLFNFSPPATEQEINDAALQFVRKVSGYHTPSKVNEAAFARAVQKIADATKEMLVSLETDANPKNREEEAAKAHERAVKRFGLK